jgi:hypothetical protein
MSSLVSINQDPHTAQLGNSALQDVDQRCILGLGLRATSGGRLLEFGACG